MMEVEVISAEETRALRHLVLWPHIEKLEDCVIEIDHREDAIHLGAKVNGRIISVCSLFELESPRIEARKPLRLRAMATHPDFRGQHAGQAVVEKAILLAQKAGHDFLWCDARAVALGFYERMGFELIDEWYDVPRIGQHKTAFFKLI